MSGAAGRQKSEPGRVVLETLEALARSGITHIPKARRRAAAAVQDIGDAQRSAGGASVESAREPILARPAAESPPQRELSRDERAAALDVIRHEVAACQRCTELATTRRQTVFGVGNPQARLVFMGEAPGADEDRQGEPFVGRAGQLLTKIIEACTLRREDVYILNTLKCRPPENRTPLAQEAANCREYLDRQLAILRPEFICCLGAVAAQNLLDTTVSIGRLRGRLHDYRGIRVLCTYHPAYLLRNPAAKKDCWQDMQLLLREMGITVV
jgi:uracil-DNA glycosylase family 4